MLGAHGRLGEIVREVVHLLEREAGEVDGEVTHDDDHVRLDDRAQHLDACGECNVVGGARSSPSLIS